MYKDEIKYLSEFYGLDSRLDLLIEEMAELTQEIIKYKRYKDSYDIYNLIEEMSDVNVVIDQIKHLMNINDSTISSIKERKVKRQMDRIANQYCYNCKYACEKNEECFCTLINEYVGVYDKCPNWITKQ